MIKARINHVNTFQVYQLLKFSSSILLSIVLAKSLLSLSEVGVFESFVFYASSVSFFWITGISQGLLTQSPKLVGTDKLNNTKYFTALISFISFSLLSIILLLVLKNAIPLDFSTSNTKSVFPIFIIYCIINPITFLSEFILLLEKNFKELIIYGFLSIIIPLVLISIAAFITISLFWCLIGLLVWTIFKFLYLICLVYKFSIFKIDYTEIIQLVKFSAPLILTALLAGSASYIDSLIINLKFDNRVFAIFRYGAREFPVFLLIANAFGTSMIPEFSKPERIKQNLNEIRENSRKMIKFAFPVAIILLLTSQDLFTWVFSRNFYISHKIFDIYLLLIISRFVFPQTILLGLKNNTLLMKVGFWELVINIITSLILVQYFGYYGVAYGTVVAYFFEKVSLALLLTKKYNIKPKQYIALKELTLYSFLILIIYILKNYLVLF